MPVTLFIGPVIAVGFGLFWLFFGRRMMAASDERYAEYRVEPLAQRLGLRIVEGDPAFNLMQARDVQNQKGYDKKVGGRVGRMLGDSAKELRVVLQGAPYGRPTELFYYAYSEAKDRLAVVFVRNEFECRLSLQVPMDLPPFEIVRRQGRLAGMGGGVVPAKPEWDLPAQSFGHPELDERLALSTTEPRLGAYLATVVGPLLDQRYVHIQGHGRVIESRGSQDATTFWVMSIEATQAVLEHMANALAGPVNAR